MPVQIGINSARTLTFTGATFVQVQNLPRRTEDLWLVVYSSSASDGRVWISTQDGIDGAGNTATNVPDRRPLTPPCQFYLGGRRSLAIGSAGAGDICVELVPTPLTPTREAPEPQVDAKGRPVPQCPAR